MRFRRYPVILAYHCVSSEQTTETPTVTPAVFEQQVRYVAQRYRLLTVSQAVREWLATGQWPSPTAVITFDDGEESVYLNAWPILRRFRVPATIFMIAGNVGRPGWLTSSQLQELARGGLEIGSHTLQHAYLPSISREQAREEIRTSKEQLTQAVQQRVETLSYPAGGFSADIQRLVQDAGYTAACTTNRLLTAHADGVIDRWALRRIKMTQRSSHSFVLRAKCSGYYDSFHRLAPAC